VQYSAEHLNGILAEGLRMQTLGQALPPPPPGLNWVNTPQGLGLASMTSPLPPPGHQWANTPYGPGVVPSPVQAPPALPPAPPGFQWVNTPHGPGLASLPVQASAAPPHAPPMQATPPAPPRAAQPPAPPTQAAAPTRLSAQDGATIETALLVIAICESSAELIALSLSLECVKSGAPIAPDVAARLPVTAPFHWSLSPTFRSAFLMGMGSSGPGSPSRTWRASLA
jgi:hypothetical protein